MKKVLGGGLFILVFIIFTFILVSIALMGYKKQVVKNELKADKIIQVNTNK